MQQVAKHKVVSIEYVLTDPEGRVIDRSEQGEPLSYIQGMGNLIPGLESALEGHTAGDSVQVTLEPDEAYGQRDAALVQDVPRERFEAGGDIEVGMMFQTPTDAGTQVVTVVDVKDESITVDANHPLAGVTLNFDVTVVEVRNATEEEIDHGHAHGPGGHHHHD